MNGSVVPCPLTFGSKAIIRPRGNSNTEHAKNITFLRAAAFLLYSWAKDSATDCVCASAKNVLVSWVTPRKNILATPDLAVGGRKGRGENAEGSGARILIVVPI